MEAAARAARTADSLKSAGRERAAASVREFAQWFTKQHQSGGISMPAEGVMDVQASLSSQFCVGMRDMRYYIAIPRELAGWFMNLPWVCAVVPERSSRLSLVCGRANAPGFNMAAFSLNFDVTPDSYTSGLVHYHYLDVRVYDPLPSKPNSIHIHCEVARILPIRVCAAADVLSALPPAA